ncbi:hypothetical protein EVAR_61840_1 [Eumeta japonica]|uniref:Uncharacterized protein n=1 Tax=Eumeta variegata TaxID=151549 RepID=A0A4C1YYK2_EUMVA|nr:hypothetical protein EVAR_61840_1 [Eumeta japonica]
MELGDEPFAGPQDDTARGRVTHSLPHPQEDKSVMYEKYLPIKRNSLVEKKTNRSNASAVVKCSRRGPAGGGASYKFLPAPRVAAVSAARLQLFDARPPSYEGVARIF